jgi:hypothetical protein
MRLRKLLVYGPIAFSFLAIAYVIFFSGNSTPLFGQPDAGKIISEATVYIGDANMLYQDITSEGYASVAITVENKEDVDAVLKLLPERDFKLTGKYTDNPPYGLRGNITASGLKKIANNEMIKRIDYRY